MAYYRIRQRNTKWVGNVNTVAMGLSRRNALIGIGTVAAGAGAVGASGAFTSVEADRSVSITAQGDAAAALQLEEASGAPELNGGTSYIDATGDTISVDVTKLNLNALTTLNPLILVTNNGNSAVSLSVDVDAGWISTVGVPSTISSGSSGVFGLELDTRGEGFSDGQTFSHTVTITAE